MLTQNLNIPNSDKQYFSFMAPQVVVMTNYGAASDDKVGIMTILGFQFPPEAQAQDKCHVIRNGYHFFFFFFFFYITLQKFTVHNWKLAWDLTS